MKRFPKPEKPVDRVRRQLQSAGYITRAEPDDQLAPRGTLDAKLVRRALAVGIRGAWLGLDTVPGVVWADVQDHGGDGYRMPPGQAHVVVWGGSLDRIVQAVERSRPAGVLVTIEHREATAWYRFRSWLRFQLWRVFGRDRPAVP